MKFEKYSSINFNYSKRYYFTHPWKWFKDLWISIKNSYMRIKYGFCWPDIWNWYDWFLYTTPQMLRYMGLHGSGTPCIKPFTDNPGRWSSYLMWLADELEKCREDKQQMDNEYYEEYIKKFNTTDWINAPHTEIDEKYFSRDKELALKAQERIKKCLNSIADTFYNLWD